MQLNKTKGFWVTVLAAVLLVPFILNSTLFQFTTPLTYQGGDWLSFWGNYSGGILSAVVAFIVARMTMNAEISKHSYDIRVGQLPGLVRIKMEMEKINRNLEKAYNSRKNNIKRCAGTDVHPEEVPIEVDLLDKDKWIYLDRVQNIDLQVRLIEIQEFYEKWSSSLRYDAITEKKKFGELIIALGIHVGGKSGTSVEQLEKSWQLENDLMYHHHIREKGWEKLDEGYRQTIKDTLQEVQAIIDDIKEEKVRFEKSK